MMLRTDPLYGQIVLTWEQIRRRLDTGSGFDDDDFAWVDGGLLLFTLLRVLLRDPRAASEAVRREIATTLDDLGARIDGAPTRGGGLPDEAELGFLSAFNDYLMARHDERVRIEEGGGLSLAALALGDRLRVAVALSDERAP
jgi:hypothetical protein